MNGTHDIRPVTFSDRVMAALAPLPNPTPTRTLVEALRTHSLRDALAALSVAWHLGTVRSWPIAPRVRARSFALVLAAVTLLGTGSLAAAAAAVHVVSSASGGHPTVEPAGAVPAAPDPTSAAPFDGAAETPVPTASEPASTASEPVLEAEPSVGPEPTKKAAADHDKATSKDGSPNGDRPSGTDDPEDRGGSPGPKGDDGDGDASDDGAEDGDAAGADDDPESSGGDDGSDEGDSVDGDGAHE